MGNRLAAGAQFQRTTQLTIVNKDACRANQHSGSVNDVRKMTDTKPDMLHHVNHVEANALGE